MKILQIVFSLGFGGAERFVVDLSNELSKNHDVTLLTLKEDKSNPDDTFYKFDLYLGRFPQTPLALISFTTSIQSSCAADIKITQQSKFNSGYSFAKHLRNLLQPAPAAPRLIALAPQNQI